MIDQKYHQTIRVLSDRIVQAQRPIRILDALKWGPEVESRFFEKACKELPEVLGPDYYAKRPLKFDLETKIEEFNQIERDIRRELGNFNSLGLIMQRMCREYCVVVEMLKARGTPAFSRYSEQLYGSTSDAFYAGAPTLKDLAVMVSETLGVIQNQTTSERDVKRYSTMEAIKILGDRLGSYFGDTENQARVKSSDDIVADAAAGAEDIKLRNNVFFSDRDLQLLEVHEGWIHLATTINGLKQPICTFLSKGPPSSTITQEGLAITAEIFSFSSYPARIQHLTNRITAVHRAENGANFLEIFDFFKNQGLADPDSYAATVRVFRGSVAEGRPFTKDLVYTKGFVLMYNYIRLAIQQGLLSRIPLLFIGKTTLEDLHVFHDLMEEGLITAPEHIPPPFSDLAALSSWMCYSLFLNQLDLKRLALEYKGIL